MTLVAKVHPANGQTGDELASVLDELDHRLRLEVPEIAYVLIEITARSRTAGEPNRRRAGDVS